MTLEFSLRIFEKKNSNIKFEENPSSGRGIVPCRHRETDRQTGRQAGGHDEANSRLSQFCECAQKGIGGGYYSSILQLDQLFIQNFGKEYQTIRHLNSDKFNCRPIVVLQSWQLVKPRLGFRRSCDCLCGHWAASLVSKQITDSLGLRASPNQALLDACVWG